MGNPNRPGLAVGTPQSPAAAASGGAGGLVQPSTTPGGDTNTHPHYQGKNAPSTGPSGMTPQQVRALQQFLTNHGFQVAQDGVMGPQTKSAAKAFRTNHKGGADWNKANGIGVHPGVQPHGNPADAPAGGGNTRTTQSAGGGGGGTKTAPGSAAFQALLQSMLASGGSVGTNLDPNAAGNAAAAPSDALVAVDQRGIRANPAQEAQNQHDISSWYGLDPKDPNYKISVLGRLAQSRTQNMKDATATAGNDSALSQALAGSIGGSANDGSSTVAAAGENAAGTAAALGQEAGQYADSMNPLLTAEATGAGLKEKGANAKALLALQDSLATDQGNSKAARESAREATIGTNNGLAQQRFANKGNLLSTLAQMQAVDPNKNYLSDLLKTAQINHTNALTNKVISGKTTTGHVFKIDPVKAAGAVGNALGYTGNKADGSGQFVVPTSDHTRLATQIGAYLRGQGFKPGDGQFKHIGDAILSTFVDQHNRPIVAPANWAV